jgi:hypothetical protein
MAQSPQFKIYRGKEYVAACKYAEDAAILVAASGGVVRFGHGLIVWREGFEAVSAGESYDFAADTMQQRIDAHNAAAYAKVYGGAA